MVISTGMASMPAIITLTILMSAYFLWTRQPYQVLSLLLAVGGGMVLNVLLKNVFSRERPGWSDAMLGLTGYSFPSGHTMMATIAYGFLASMLIGRSGSWFWRCLIGATTVFVVMLVALSRMYLGAHFLSDVLAASAAGTAWLALCIASVEAFRRHMTGAG